MSIINYAQKEISFKIVYYGTGVAGKTANLQYIYRGLPDVNRATWYSSRRETTGRSSSTSCRSPR
jgi:GTPase SAR1 family protein